MIPQQQEQNLDQSHPVNQNADQIPNWNEQFFFPQKKKYRRVEIWWVQKILQFIYRDYHKVNCSTRTDKPDNRRQWENKSFGENGSIHDPGRKDIQAARSVDNSQFQFFNILLAAQSSITLLVVPGKHCQCWACHSYPAIVKQALHD